MYLNFLKKAGRETKAARYEQQDTKAARYDDSKIRNRENMTTIAIFGGGNKMRWQQNVIAAR